MPATTEQALKSLAWLQETAENMPTIFDEKPAKIFQHSLTGALYFHLRVVEEALRAQQ